jgi:hypothetical protein
VLADLPWREVHDGEYQPADDLAAFVVRGQLRQRLLGAEARPEVDQ